MSCGYLSMLGWKLIHVGKGGPCNIDLIHTIIPDGNELIEQIGDRYILCRAV